MTALNYTAFDTGDETGPVSILLAEDNEVTQELMTLLLTRRGHQVDTVEDGEAALQALQLNEYDIVIVDFHMPKMDGLEVVINFRNTQDALSKMPCFIGMTADIEGLLAHPANCENFDHVFAKPFDAMDICSAIENTHHVKHADPLIVPASHDASQSSSVKPRLAVEDGKEKTDMVSQTENRHARRAVVSLDGTKMRMADGSVWDCRITNISSGGAAVDVDIKPPIGVDVYIGRNHARIVHHTENGIAVEFAENLS